MTLQDCLLHSAVLIQVHSLSANKGLIKHISFPFSKGKLLTLSVDLSAFKCGSVKLRKYSEKLLVRDPMGCSCSLKGTLCVIYQKKAETSLSLKLQAAFLYQ